MHSMRMKFKRTKILISWFCVDYTKICTHQNIPLYGIMFSLQLYVPHPVSMVEHVFNQMYVSVHQAGQDINVEQVKVVHNKGC